MKELIPKISRNSLRGSSGGGPWRRQKCRQFYARVRRVVGVVDDVEVAVFGFSGDISALFRIGIFRVDTAFLHSQRGAAA